MQAMPEWWDINNYNYNHFRIARAYTYSGWSSNTAVYSSIRSDPIELEEGEQYLLVGDMAEGSGGDFIRVSL